MTRLTVASATAVMVFASVGLRPSVAIAASGDVGYEDESFSGTSEPTSTKRAESVLWWNDGSWWASMWDRTSQDFHIFRLNVSTQTWVDTGTTLDPRADSHADVLWDGGHLFVSSHLTIPDEQPAVSGYPSYLYRYSYNSVAKTYSLDSGFPVQINNEKTETLVIDKDSTGKLWATWQQNNRIYVNRTLNGDDHTWGTPFVLPATGTSVTVDDNSAVIAFGGDRIGVMWSNQSSSNDAVYFATHVDRQPDTSWETARTAIQGPNTSDDHINLKSLQADGSGRVYAAIKTSFTNSAQPLIMLLVRDRSTGNWASYPIARVSDCPNRPMVLIDEENRVLHSFFSAPAPPGYACNSSGGAIYEKTSPLDAIAFPLGSGTPVVVDADSPYVHNVSSTKQNVTSRTGIVVLARNSHTARYWHHYESLSGSSPSAPVANFSGTPTSGTAPLAVAFHNSSTGSPTSWSWTFGDGGASTAQNPTHTYGAAGTYTVSLTVANSAGSNTLTRAGYVSVNASGGQVVRESVSTVVNATATSSVAIPAPAGTTLGDVLVACLALNGSSVSSSGVPAGWTLIAAALGGANPHTLGYYHVAGSAEPASFTWRLSASVANGAGIARYSGVRAASPIDATATTASGASATTGTLPGLTTATPGAMLVGCMAINSSSTGVSIGAPIGMAEAWDIGGKRQELADRIQSAAGPSGSKTWTFSSAREWAGWLVALRPN
ncbi:MAG: PKD domain-containing protein [Chloroflexota bacterium]